MEELIFELKTLNESVQRLIDFFIPAQDPKIFDEFKALKVVSRNSRLALRGIADPDPIRFSELRGIDSVIQNLRENTEHFIEGLPCNNVLLHGPRGTGKSQRSRQRSMNMQRGDSGWWRCRGTHSYTFLPLLT